MSTPLRALVLLFLLPLTPWGQSPSLDELYEAQLERAGERRAQLEAASEGLDEEESAGMRYLIAHMPPHDLRSLSAEFLRENVQLAYAARRAAPWSARVPEELFLQSVLPYAHVTERRDPWRAELRERFAESVLDCETPGEAALRLNSTIFGELGVRYSTARERADQSPSQSIESGLASCTGLSILLADACRAVGVPARLAGIYSWPNKNGNHTWVEVWDDGWHYVGAAEPDGRGLNHTWFTGDAALAQPGSREHGVWAAIWGEGDGSFPAPWAPGVDWIGGVDVSTRYARPGEAGPGAGRQWLLVDVRDGRGGPRVAAEVSIASQQQAGERFHGTARDASVDTNDILRFTVPEGHAWEVESRWAGRTARVVREVFEGAQHHLTLQLVEAESEAGDDQLEALRDWFGADPEQRAQLELDPALDALALTDEPTARALAWEAYLSSGSEDPSRADQEASRVRNDGHESPYVVREVGERPEAGWGLVIAMHGGGGAPKRVNDSQWEHMQIYYRDQPDLPGYRYLALRAPNDTWNGFYTGYVWPLIEALIRQEVRYADVDPDRVYLIGYSHGGYGAFAIGPNIPYRFAAVHASAAAPTGGITNAINLRNTPFSAMIGEHDEAYGRIERCRAFAAEVAAIEASYGVDWGTVVDERAGFGHGGLPDRDKLRDLLPLVREPSPRALSWKPLGGVVRDHFWLHLPAPQSGQHIEARVEDNRVELTTEGVEELVVGLDARLVDFSRPVTLARDGEERTLELTPSFRVLLETLEERGDLRLASVVRVQL